MGANAQLEVPAFTAGQILTAAEMTQVNTGIPVFATTVTRDAAFGGTGEKTLAQGQYAYIEATSTLQVYNGSAWVAAVSSGLTLIKTQTIGTGVTSVAVTDAFSATYDTYKITISGGVGSAANNEFFAILTGSTVGYNYAGVFTNYNSTAGGTGASGASAWGFWGGIDTTSLSLNVDLTNPFLAKNTHFQTFATRTGLAGSAAGIHTVASSFTGFTLTPALGTITGGTIRVYGYQNS
jgi:hypothetical protein